MIISTSVSYPCNTETSLFFSSKRAQNYQYNAAGVTLEGDSKGNGTQDTTKTEHHASKSFQTFSQVEGH